MNRKILFKEGDEVMLDTLMLNCGWHINCCNNGYSCINPENGETMHDDCKNKCSGCFAFSCPLAYQKDPEGDDKNQRWGGETIMILNENIYEDDADKIKERFAFCENQNGRKDE